MKCLLLVALLLLAFSPPAWAATQKVMFLADTHDIAQSSLATMQVASDQAAADGCSAIVNLGDLSDSSGNLDADISAIVQGLINGTGANAIPSYFLPGAAGHDLYWGSADSFRQKTVACPTATPPRLSWLGAIVAGQTAAGMDPTQSDSATGVLWTFDAGAVRFIGFDTTYMMRADQTIVDVGSEAIPDDPLYRVGTATDLSNVHVSAAALAALHTALQAADDAGKWSVVCMHYPVGFNFIDATPDRFYVAEFAAVRAECEGHKVIAVLNGHLHGTGGAPYGLMKIWIGQNSATQPIMYLTIPADYWVELQVDDTLGICGFTAQTGALSMPVYRWTNGGGDGLWSNVNNWIDHFAGGAPGAAPGSAAHNQCVIFPSGAANCSNDSTGSTYVLQQVFLLPGYTGTVTNASNLSIYANALWVAPGATFNYAANTSKYFQFQYVLCGGTLTGSANLMTRWAVWESGSWFFPGAGAFSGINGIIIQARRTYSSTLFDPEIPMVLADLNLGTKTLKINNYSGTNEIIAFSGTTTCGARTIASAVNGLSLTCSFTGTLVGNSAIVIGDGTTGTVALTLGGNWQASTIARGGAAEHALTLSGRGKLSGTFTGTGLTVTKSQDGEIDCWGTGVVTNVTATGNRLVVRRAVDAAGMPLRSWQGGTSNVNVRFLPRKEIGSPGVN